MYHGNLAQCIYLIDRFALWTLDFCFDVAASNQHFGKSAQGNNLQLLHDKNTGQKLAVCHSNVCRELVLIKNRTAHFRMEIH